MSDVHESDCSVFFFDKILKFVKSRSICLAWHFVISIAKFGFDTTATTIVMSSLLRLVSSSYNNILKKATNISSFDYNNRALLRSNAARRAYFMITAKRRVLLTIMRSECTSRPTPATLFAIIDAASIRCRVCPIVASHSLGRRITSASRGEKIKRALASMTTLTCSNQKQIFIPRSFFIM